MTQARRKCRGRVRAPSGRQCIVEGGMRRLLKGLPTASSPHRLHPAAVTPSPHYHITPSLLLSPSKGAS